MTIDLKAIRAAAEAVPKNKLRVCHDFGQFYALIGDGYYFHGRVRGKERADFVTIADPATVIALLDRLEAAEKEAAHYRMRIAFTEAKLTHQKDNPDDYVMQY